MFEYQSGPVASVDFPFFGFLQTMEEFKGSRKHQEFPEGYKFTVQNKEWDMGVDVYLKDLERAANTGSLKGLDPYRLRISEMAAMIKSHPVELAYLMLAAGEANTYGTCFDGQNLFDTTHSYSVSAGTQDNILTGGGTSIVNLHDDIVKCLSKFAGFSFDLATDQLARRLNRDVTKLFIIAPNELNGALFSLKNKELLGTTAGAASNSVKNTFDYITLPFADANDWYAILDDETMFKPFLYQIEKGAVIDQPSPNDESIRENRRATYGAYGRYNVAYGSWWKVVKVTNA